MNTKTTLFLAVVLVVVGAVFLYVRALPEPAQMEKTPDFSASSAATRDLFEEPLGDVVKVVCQRGDDEPWVFEKEADGEPSGQWQMTSPHEMPCVRWEVEKFGNRLGRLRYELSYQPDEPGAVTAAQAGLDPPQAVVTLTDAGGKSATVEIGKAAGRRETYVRLAGGAEIVVGKDDLTDLVKDKWLDYRDKQVFDFPADDATRVEIIDRSVPAEPVTYTFQRDGDRWMMAAPVTARATDKVGTMLTAMARLRVADWQDDRAEVLAGFGLEPAALTVRATVEERVPIEQESDDGEDAAGEEMESEPAAEDDEEAPGDEEEDAPEFETRISTYELHLSSESPLGEPTKTYLRIDDETAVATVLRTTADKFKPVMAEWREMRITTVDVDRATGIKLSTPQGPASLFKRDGAWYFDPDEGRAEDKAVSDMLSAVGNLAAVAFVDEPSEDLSTFGLESPRGEVQLTIPGVEGVERIAVGAFTDEQTKRLVYVRRNDLASVAKVRAPDADVLLKGPEVYRDRTIVEVLPSRFERIGLSSAPRGFDDVASAETVVLERSGSDWTMTEPARADVRTDRVDSLIEALGGLRAEQVVAERDEETAYGLHAPAVKVAITYRTEDAPQPEEDEAGADSAGEMAATENTLELAVAEHDGKVYAMRADRGTVYEVSNDFLETLLAEVRTDRVLEFPDDQVMRFSLRKGDRTDTFQRRDDGWIYEAEPDLPLDPAKVDNLLLQLRDLRTDRYVRHGDHDPESFGLSAPERLVTVSLANGTDYVLRISSQVGGRGDEAGHYASLDRRPGVFILTGDSLQRFEVRLNELERTP
jgi:hypothetical protein